MHTSIINWVSSILSSKDVKGKKILEVGSYDVNGSVRPIIEAKKPNKYIGVDLAAGPRVDQVIPCHRLIEEFGVAKFDLVISTEMLEHVRNWIYTWTALVDMVHDGGRLIVTTRSPGFPYHPYPIDVWRYTVNNMQNILQKSNMTGTVISDPEMAGVFVDASKPNKWNRPWKIDDPIQIFKGIDVQQITPAW